LTSALEGGEVLASRPGRTLPPGKTRYPFCRRLGGPQGLSGLVRKISLPPGMMWMWVQKCFVVQRKMKRIQVFWDITPRRLVN